MGLRIMILKKMTNYNPYTLTKLRIFFGPIRANRLMRNIAITKDINVNRQNRFDYLTDTFFAHDFSTRFWHYSEKASIFSKEFFQEL